MASPPALAAAGAEPDPMPPALSDAIRQLTDVGGWRSGLEQAGVTFAFTSYADALVNPVGGVRQGPGYSGRFGAIVDGDLEKLAGWQGAAFHASIHGVYGYGLSTKNIDNLMLVSSVEAPNSFRLFNLWVEQKWDGGISLRVGQYTAAQEFLVSKTAGLFVNSTFGWPVLPAQDLPSGGPAYPEAALGARLLYRPNDRFTFRAAVFDGDPAGPGVGAPVSRDPYGLAFRLGDSAFTIAEMVYHYGQAPQDNLQQEGDSAGAQLAQGLTQGLASGASLPGAIKFGAWYIAGSFADPRQNGLEHGGNYSVYGVLDQVLWRPDPSGDRGLGFFLRLAGAPGDRNLIDLYTDAGLTFQGPLEARPDDSIGIAFACGRVSPQQAAYDRAFAAVTKIPVPIRDFEAAVELTYQIQFAKSWMIQPDLQYIVHPGGNIANPRPPGGVAPIPNALVIGLRSVLKF